MMKWFDEIKTINSVSMIGIFRTNAFIDILYKVPFLAVKEEFHPKRNQARQKLATLPVARFQDLASDVYSELTRRYPNLIENDVGQ